MYVCTYARMHVCTYDFGQPYTLRVYNPPAARHTWRLPLCGAAPLLLVRQLRWLPGLAAAARERNVIVCVLVSVCVCVNLVQ
jgi:hypothetical protein